ncbi:RVT_3 domain-containing protein [Cephalotus follicularis]|uniref:RVT_3 domain-containing protein n=1 Tax=Cephalotus follicularis TaxID=3775 RepID=A0A1Q3DGU3_CEPFO|nr:RVT_3 domain-containing protein [Cephalotus follicularis]
MPGKVRLNCDGAVCSDGACSGLRWLFRDLNGLILAVGSRCVSPQYDLATIEALSILHGMLCGKHVGLNKLVVESDAGVIVEVINSSSMCEAIYGNFIEDIKDLIKDF